jgi:hypothetical protein
MLCAQSGTAATTAATQPISKRFMVFSSLLSHRRDAAFAHIPGSIRHRRAPHRDRGLRASLLDCSTTDYPTDFENKEYGAEKWRTSLSLFAAGMSSFIVGIFQHGEQDSHCRAAFTNCRASLPRIHRSCKTRHRVFQLKLKQGCSAARGAEKIPSNPIRIMPAWEAFLAGQRISARLGSLVSG